MERNIRELTAKVHDLELQMTYLKKDNDMFVQKNSLLQEEVLRLTEQIKELEPKLLKLESEYTRLSEEKSLWSSQRENNNKELHEYKLVSTTLNELHYGLQSLTESEGDVAEKHSDIYTLSQKHVMWCGIPALRRLSSPLYDRIREMFQDLRRMEKEISDCRDNYEVDAEDLKVALRNKSNELEQKVLIAQESKKKLEQLTYRLQECESELHDTRETSAILDNVRIVLKSSACTVMSKSGISPSKSNKSSVSRFHPTDYNDLQQPLDDMNLYDLAESGLDNDGPTGNEAVSIICKSTSK
jgi:chromosome segregation ATPase